MKSQKEAVINAVMSVFPDYELGGETILKSLMSRDQRNEIVNIVFEGFQAGEVQLNQDAKANESEEELLKYTKSLIDNWVRKHPEFNAMFPESGGVYRAKNPGSRAGSNDEQIRELRKLKKTTDDPTVIAEIDEAIALRQAEIKPAKSVTINVDALPEHLRHLVPSNTEETTDEE